MRVWGLWHGGINYAEPYGMDYLEEFPSIEAARDALVSRAFRGYWQQQEFRYVNREPESTFTPGADTDCRMAIYFSNPTADTGAYADRVYRIGPRGGIYWT